MRPLRPGHRAGDTEEETWKEERKPDHDFGKSTEHRRVSRPQSVWYSGPTKITVWSEVVMRLYIRSMLGLAHAGSHTQAV